MYEDIFRAQSRPFRATPDAKFYFPHPSVEAARQAAVRAVQRAEGPALILGGAGLGKSLLADVLSKELSAEFDVVRLHAAQLCSRMALLQGILFELDLPYVDKSEGELRLAILDRLEPDQGFKANGIVIVVDEAHTLPSKLLDELRLLSNFTRNNLPRAQVILLGNMQLEETFATPELESFNQRLAARCYLSPMSEEDTRAYVEHQLRCVKIDPYAFLTHDAVDTVYAGCEGVARIANQVVDHAIVLAMTNDAFPITADLVEEAWADLQQLPVPWSTPNPRADAMESSTPENGETQQQLPSSDPPEEKNTTAHAGHISDDYAAEVPAPITTVGTAESSTPETQQTPHAEVLESLDALADEIANVQRVSYDVEFGELSNEPTQTNTGGRENNIDSLGGATEAALQAEAQAENSAAESSAQELESQEAYEELIGLGIQPVDASVSGYELSCVIDIGDSNEVEHLKNVFHQFQERLDASVQADSLNNGNDSPENVAETSLPADEFSLNEPASQEQLADEIETADEHQVESLEAPAPRNFFAAFNSPEEGEFPAEIEAALSSEEQSASSGSPTDPSDAVDDNKEAVSASTVESQPTAHADEDASGIDPQVPNILPADSFFSARPTDEQLIAFEEEQEEYQAMGMWGANANSVEPTIEIVQDTLTDEPDVTSTDVSTDASAALSPAGDALFGGDFEEEMSLADLAKSQRPKHTEQEISPTGLENSVPDTESEAPLVQAPPQHEAPTVSAKSEEDSTRHIEPAPSQNELASENVAGHNLESPGDASSTSDQCPAEAPTQSAAAIPEVVAEPAAVEVTSIPTAAALPASISPADTPQANDSSIPELEGTPAAGTVEQVAADQGVNDFSSCEVHAVPTEPVAEEASTPPETSSADQDNWSVDVVAVDVAKEALLQDEIEDLVSQLNFSGMQFSVSEEQIPPTPTMNADKAAASAQSEADEESETQVATAASLGGEIFAEPNAEYDDDRDMLIVEEEVTPQDTMKPAATQVNLPKHRSYSQLFAKLRG